MDLTLHSETAVVSIDGELDLLTAQQAQGLVDRALAAEPHLLVFDLRGLTFIDSAGIALLVRANRRMRNVDGTVAVANATKRVADVLRSTGLDAVIRIDVAPLDDAELLAVR